MDAGDVGGEEVEKSCCSAYMKDPRVKTKQPVCDDALGLPPSPTVTPKYKIKLSNLFLSPCLEGRSKFPHKSVKNETKKLSLFLVFL